METLHPGLYLQEVKGETPVQGVSTSTGAFVGVTTKGKLGSTLVTSWSQYLEEFGGYINDSYLAYAVRGFFENGGTRAYISRAVKLTDGVKTSAKATATIKEGATNAVIVDALSDGTHGNDLEFEIAEFKDGKFNVIIHLKGLVVEKYEALTLPVLEDILLDSKHVRVTVAKEDAVLVNGKTKLAGGNDGIEGISGTDYLAALSAFDNDKINLLAIPGITDVAVLAGLVTYAENRKDVFVVSEVPFGKDITGASKYKMSEANVASDRVGLYYPWISVADPIGVGKNPTKFIPPSGHIMGIYARTDNNRGVYKAPAGTEAKVRGAIGLEYKVTDPEQDLLNPIGVNCIRAFDGEGIIIWGARSTDAKGEFRYLSNRRAHDFIGQSVLGSTRWSVFEPNDEILWSKLTATIEAFLRGFWRAGGLKGKDESEAFFVECNGNTTTKDDIEAGRTFVKIGVAHQKPSEFVIFQLSVRK